MEKRNSLFFSILRELQKENLLEDIILIGSWCQLFYRYYFKNAPEIPAVRTLDIDFLIPNPCPIKKDVNIPKVLLELDFEPVTDYISGLTKYNHPDLAIEFLIHDKGRGKSEPYKIPNLHIEAQGLRFLNLLQDYIIKIKYKDITIKVPEPSAYVLHKFIISQRRIKKEKEIKDLESARSIGEFLLQDKKQRQKLKTIFNLLPKKWQKKIKYITKEKSTPIYDFLI